MGGWWLQAFHKHGFRVTMKFFLMWLILMSFQKEGVLLVCPPTSSALPWISRHLQAQILHALNSSPSAGTPCPSTILPPNFLKLLFDDCIIRLVNQWNPRVLPLKQAPASHTTYRRWSQTHYARYDSKFLSQKLNQTLHKTGCCIPEQLLIYNNSELVVKGKIQEFAKL